ncbi:MAG TPA: hypothetical protein VD999_00345 [Vitreimonas sp.]|nr:hypothetical protein [Vitreimonas sp.]
MKKLNIRLPATLFLAFHEKAKRSGVTKSSLLKAWLRRPMPFFQIQRVYSQQPQISYSFNLSESEAHLTTKIATEFGVSVNLLLIQVIKTHTQDLLFPSYSSQIPTEIASSSVIIKGKDNFRKMYLSLINERNLSMVTDDEAFEQLFPDNFYEFIYAMNKGYLNIRSIAIPNEVGKAFYTKALAISPQFSQSNKFHSGILQPNCLGYLISPTKFIVEHGGTEPQATIITDPQLVQYAHTLFNMQWQTLSNSD